MTMAAPNLDKVVEYAAPATPREQPYMRIPFPIKFIPFMPKDIHIVTFAFPIALNNAAHALYTANAGIDMVVIMK